jgi:hypothetical protein
MGQMVDSVDSGRGVGDGNGVTSGELAGLPCAHNRLPLPVLRNFVKISVRFGNVEKRGYIVSVIR